MKDLHRGREALRAYLEQNDQLEFVREHYHAWLYGAEGAEDPEHSEDPYLSVWGGTKDAELVRLLIEAGADPNGENPAGQRTLSMAVHDYAGEAVYRTLLEHGADPDSGGTCGYTPLQAATDRDYRAIPVLLSYGANANGREGDSPAVWALHSRHGISPLHMLMQSGADPNTRSHDGYTLIELAAEYLRFTELDYLIACGASVEPLERSIHFTAAAGLTEAVAAHCDAGCDPDVLDRHGRTPLMMAVQGGRSSTASLLLKAGADPNLRARPSQASPVWAGGVHTLWTEDHDLNWLHRPLLTYAAEAGLTGIASALVAKGARIDADDGSALRAACESGSIEISRLLLDSGANPNARRTSPPHSPLLAAAARPDPSGRKLVEMLIVSGARVDELIEEGTALMAASSRGGEQNLQELLDRGADPDVRDTAGWTALMSAAQSGADRCVELLLRHGADPALRTDEGQTALSIALEQASEARLDEIEALGLARTVELLQGAARARA